MAVVTSPPPDASPPLRPHGELGALALSRSAAIQRRAMQAAMAGAVREMRSATGRRGRSLRPHGAPPTGCA